MKKYIVLFLIALFPVILGIFGYHSLGDETDRPANMHVIAAALVSIPINALIGGVIALLLKRRKAVWWAMLVCFLYSYFGFGITLGGFGKEGGWGIHTLNSAVLMAVVGYIGCLFTWGMYNVIRRQIDLINGKPQPMPKHLQKMQQQQQHTTTKPKKK